LGFPSVRHHIKGIIFDLDGTLVDSRRDLAAAVNRMRDECNLPALSVDTVTAHIGDGVRNLVTRSLAGTDIDVDKALPRFKQHYMQHLVDHTTCYPGVQETLEALAGRGIKCAVITNKHEAAAREILTRLGLAAFFDPIVGGDSTPYLKPDPRPLLQVAEQWRLKPEQMLVVGDHDTDVTAAHRAGMNVVFMKSGFGRLRDEQPDFVADDWRALQALTGL
jgi:phosphoglycolate phosphatase